MFFTAFSLKTAVTDNGDERSMWKKTNQGAKRCYNSPLELRANCLGVHHFNNNSCHITHSYLIHCFDQCSCEMSMKRLMPQRSSGVSDRNRQMQGGTCCRQCLAFTVDNNAECASRVEKE